MTREGGPDPIAWSRGPPSMEPLTSVHGAADLIVWCSRPLSTEIPTSLEGAPDLPRWGCRAPSTGARYSVDGAALPHGVSPGLPRGSTVAPTRGIGSSLDRGPQLPAWSRGAPCMVIAIAHEGDASLLEGARASPRKDATVGKRRT